ncbi:MAG TPA: hypothetical protein VJ884_02340, partial [Salinibacter sp.]|nr:hypothetical protein [Salinibacter sp.]
MLPPPISRTSLLLTVMLMGTLLLQPNAAAQDSAPSEGPAVNLTVGTVGLSIGDSRRVTGLRFNYRDRYLDRVHGLNLTLWRPYDDAGGTINGIAVGLPLTGGDQLRGISIGAGLMAQTALQGISVGILGVGSDGRLGGIGLGGIGIGAGDRLHGLMVGGLGAGAGDDA